MPDPESTVDAAPAAGRMRVRWNAAKYPMALVRDAATGQVMGYVRRSGDAVVSGEPSELLLWLWGRRPDSAVSQEGDTALLRVRDDTAVPACTHQILRVCPSIGTTKGRWIWPPRMRSTPALAHARMACSAP